MNVFPGLKSSGFAVAEGALDSSLIGKLISHFETAEASASTLDRNGHSFAMRNLLRDHSMIRELANSPAMQNLVEPVLGTAAIAVRGILFDKTTGANWKVPWHQDLSIAVTERAEVAGYGPWSVKAGVPHVQPPAAVLQKMLTVRLHLDDCGSENGPLLVLPGSHLHGALDGNRIHQLRREAAQVVAIVKRGGAVLVRPLLLHASHAATSPGHRRVIHIEYSAVELPEPLRWFIA